MIFIKRIELYFLLAIFLVLLYSIQTENIVLDFPVHDTYFVIDVDNIIWIMGTYIAVSFLMYLVFHLIKIKTLKWLGYLHVTFTYIPLIYVLYWLSIVGIDKKYFSMNYQGYDFLFINMLVFTAFISGIAIFLFHFIVLLYKAIKKR